MKVKRSDVRQLLAVHGVERRVLALSLGRDYASGQKQAPEDARGRLALAADDLRDPDGASAEWCEWIAERLDRIAAGEDPAEVLEVKRRRGRASRRFRTLAAAYSILAVAAAARLESRPLDEPDYQRVTPEAAARRDARELATRHFPKLLGEDLERPLEWASAIIRANR